MLVLARRAGESLRIGPDVRITVVRLGSGQVKLAIEAPAELVVHREEVWQRIAEANREAALGEEVGPAPAVPVAETAQAQRGR